jgi:hypothetical protein
MFLQPSQSIFEKTLAPHADDLTPGVESSGDSIVGQTFGGEQDHSGADHLKIRQRILGGAAAQFPLLGGREHYRVSTGAWHREGVLTFHYAIREWISQLKNTL